jgi:hypothetical protein
MTDERTNTGFLEFKPALHGVRNGRPVRVIAFKPGDHYLTVDESLTSRWDAIDAVKLIDTNCVPVTPESMNAIAQATQQYAGSSKR